LNFSSAADEIQNLRFSKIKKEEKEKNDVSFQPKNKNEKS
jgi:hypothetical protein